MRGPRIDRAAAGFLRTYDQQGFKDNLSLRRFKEARVKVVEQTRVLKRKEALLTSFRALKRKEASLTSFRASWRSIE
jgi:hypothetical protein